MTSPLFLPEWQLFSSDGTPLAGGQVFLYQVGTLTQKVAWYDPDMVTPVGFPIILSSGGTVPQIWGSGQYRVRVLDGNSNLISDTVTTSALSEAAVSSIMLPILGATTLGQAQNLFGIPALIDAAVKNVTTLPGSTGATGAGFVGPLGSTGATGPIGATGSFSPPAQQSIVLSGITATDALGYVNVVFDTAYPTQLIQVTTACALNLTTVFLISSSGQLTPVGQTAIVNIGTVGFNFRLFDGSGIPLPNLPVQWYSIGN